MFKRIKISNQNKKNHFANKNENIENLRNKKFLIYKYYFKVDIKTSEFRFIFER